MGLDPGWVTDPALGLSLAQQLAALGNGVMPIQAETALRSLLDTRRRLHARGPGER
jgi:DNA (cytosine-5)-methyltransferase 1